jgi:hypothetical protein
MTNKNLDNRAIWIRPVYIETHSGNVFPGHSLRLSKSGIAIRLVGDLKKDKKIKIHILIDSQWHSVEGKVVINKKSAYEKFPHTIEIGAVFINPHVAFNLWKISKSATKSVGAFL